MIFKLNRGDIRFFVRGGGVALWTRVMGEKGIDFVCFYLLGLVL